MTVARRTVVDAALAGVDGAAVQNYENYDHPIDRHWDAKRRRPPAEALATRSRKDRRRWCAGHVGREHQIEVAIKDWSGGHPRSCGAQRSYVVYPAAASTEQVHWRCWEQEHCTACGRWLGSVKICSYRATDAHA